MAEATSLVAALADEDASFHVDEVELFAPLIFPVAAGSALPRVGLEGGKPSIRVPSASLKAFLILKLSGQSRWADLSFFNFHARLPLGPSEIGGRASETAVTAAERAAAQAHPDASIAQAIAAGLEEGQNLRGARLLEIRPLPCVRRNWHFLGRSRRDGSRKLYLCAPFVAASSPEGLPRFLEAVAADPSLVLEALREDAYGFFAELRPDARLGQATALALSGGKPRIETPDASFSVDAEAFRAAFLSDRASELSSRASAKLQPLGRALAGRCGGQPLHSLLRLLPGIEGGAAAIEDCLATASAPLYRSKAAAGTAGAPLARLEIPAPRWEGLEGAGLAPVDAERRRELWRGFCSAAADLADERLGTCDCRASERRFVASSRIGEGDSAAESCAAMAGLAIELLGTGLVGGALVGASAEPGPFRSPSPLVAPLGEERPEPEWPQEGGLLIEAEGLADPSALAASLSAGEPVLIESVSDGRGSARHRAAPAASALPPDPRSIFALFRAKPAPGKRRLGPSDSRLALLGHYGSFASAFPPGESLRGLLAEARVQALGSSALDAEARRRAVEVLDSIELSLSDGTGDVGLVVDRLDRGAGGTRSPKEEHEITAQDLAALLGAREDSLPPEALCRRDRTLGALGWLMGALREARVSAGREDIWYSGFPSPFARCRIQAFQPWTESAPGEEDRFLMQTAPRAEALSWFADGAGKVSDWRHWMLALAGSFDLELERLSPTDGYFRAITDRSGPVPRLVETRTASPRPLSSFGLRFGLSYSAFPAALASLPRPRLLVAGSNAAREGIAEAARAAGFFRGAEVLSFATVDEFLGDARVEEVLDGLFLAVLHRGNLDEGDRRFPELCSALSATGRPFVFYTSGGAEALSSWGSAPVALLPSSKLARPAFLLDLLHGPGSRPPPQA
jgi:hypothetical protein